MTNEATLPLEDSHLDIIAKAKSGLKLDDEELINQAGISPTDLDRIRSGKILLEPLSRLGLVLGLNSQALANVALKKWRPEPVTVPGLTTFTAHFEDMTVNCYLVWDAVSKKAIAFDSSDAFGMLDFAFANMLDIELILITHSHRDHIFDLNRLREATDAPALIGDKEPAVVGTQTFVAGKSFQVGNLTIQSRLTRGHAEGGITYIVKGLSRTIAIVGDAIFAGSMGGGKISYTDAIQTASREIMSLPDETVIASGHGPLTTVGEEKKHNPFFAI